MAKIEIGTIAHVKEADYPWVIITRTGKLKSHLEKVKITGYYEEYYKVEYLENEILQIDNVNQGGVLFRKKDIVLA